MKSFQMYQGCIMLSEIEKDKCHVISRMWNLKNKINKQKENGPIQIQRPNGWLPEESWGWQNSCEGCRGTNFQLCHKEAREIK